MATEKTQQPKTSTTKSKSSNKFSVQVTIRRRQYERTTFRFLLEEDKKIARLTTHAHGHPPTDLLLKFKQTAFEMLQNGPENEQFRA